MSERIPRVNQLFKKEISKIIVKEFEMPLGVLTTITRVEVTPNLIQARVFVSVIPEGKFAEIFKYLKNNVYNIQQKVNKKLAMRPVPKIIFVEERKTREAARIEELLDQLKNPRE